MNLLVDTYEWLTTSANWRGSDGIVHRLGEHARLSIWPIVAAIVVAIPLGTWLGHVKRGGRAAVAVVNLGRAIPSYGLLAICLPFVLDHGLGLGFWPTFPPLFVLAVPPMVANSFIGVSTIDPQIIEAARGMGLTGGQVMRRIELPLAFSLIMSGIRIASVQVIATSTIAAFVAGGGLGLIIRQGTLSIDGKPKILAGAFLVAALALSVDLVLALLERRIGRRFRARPAAL